MISILALLLSGLGLYFSQLQTSFQLEAVVLEADPSGGVAFLQVGILNQGTHKVIITKANLHQDTSDNALSVESPFMNVVTSPSLPVSLGPKDVLLLSFKGPFVLSHLYDRGDKPDRGSGLENFNKQPTRKISVSVNLQAIDFRGQPQVAHLGLFSSHITRTSVAGWTLLGNQKTSFNHE